MASIPADLLDSVVALARAAGAAILELYARTDVAVTSKQDRSPLTEADLASHRVLVAGLERIMPGIPVLSEESKAETYDVRRAWRRLWLIDPLDGTKEFLKRNGEFTVNVALLDDGKPVLGVVHAPALDTSYWASADGAFRHQRGVVQAIHVAGPVAGTLEIVASRSHAGAETDAFLQRMAEHHQVHDVAIGSSLKLCLVADGTAHLYPRFGPTMEWDTAAAQCVVEVAGGRVTDLSGEPLRYNKPDLLNPFFVAAGPVFEWRRYLA